jgi:hypothetical protein
MMAFMPTAALFLLALAAESSVSRLRVVNGCDKEPIWVAHMAQRDNGPDGQNIRLEPGAHFDFATPDGLAGTRYWPKMRCNPDGNDCAIGESGGPGENCNSESGCAPPVDTKFEASFNANGEDWVDISLVDGYTLPFKFEMRGGGCGAGFGNRSDVTLPGYWGQYCDDMTGKHYYIDHSTGERFEDPPKIIDCSNLALDQCPTAENMGTWSAANLNVVKPGGTGESVGCYSPCSKLIFDHWGNTFGQGLPATDGKVAPYCCPTPPMSPQACRAGPVRHTQFVQNMHKMCAGVYGYAYDDGMGLLRCSPQTKYIVTFYCPARKTVPTPPPLHLDLRPCTTTSTTSTHTTVTVTMTTVTGTTITVQGGQSAWTSLQPPWGLPWAPSPVVPPPATMPTVAPWLPTSTAAPQTHPFWDAVKGIFGDLALSKLLGLSEVQGGSSSEHAVRNRRLLVGALAVIAVAVAILALPFALCRSRTVQDDRLLRAMQDERMLQPARFPQYQQQHHYGVVYPMP